MRTHFGRSGGRFLLHTGLGLALFLLFAPELACAPQKSQQLGKLGRLGPETLVSVNQDGGALRCEPSAAVSGDNTVVAWNDSWGGRHSSSVGVAVAWAISRDAGKSFRFGGYLPAASQDQVPSGADSWVVADAQGNFYLQVLSWQPNLMTIYVYFMDRGDLGNWQRVSKAAEVNTAGGAFLDKPALIVDDAGRLSLVFTSGKPGSKKAIAFVSSEDRGRTWSEPLAVSADSDVAKLGVSVARIGEQVMAAWVEGDGLKSPAQIMYALSRDGGKNFGDPKLLFQQSKMLGSIPGYVFGFSDQARASLPNAVWLAAARGVGGKAHFSLAIQDRTDAGLRILIFEWPAESEAWSSPIEISPEAGKSAAFFPSLAAAGNRIAALYYYRPKGLENGITDVYLTLVTPQKGLFHTKLSSAASDWTTVSGDKQFAPVQRNFGDYITLAASGKRFVAVWTDGRNAQPRIYCRRFDLGD